MPETSASLLAGGPPSAAIQTQTSDPLLGVPGNYNTLTYEPLPPGVQGPPTPRGGTPVFRESDVWLPGSSSSEQVARLQREMIDAGVFEKGDEFIPGVWDATSRSRYAEMLAVANAAGIGNVPDALARYSQVRTQYGGAYKVGEGYASTPPKLIRLTNPDDIRSVGDRVSQSTLGRRLTDDEASRLVASYQSMEQAAGSAETGVYTAAPDVTTAAETFARRAAPTEATAHDMALGYDVLSRLIDEEL